MEESTINILSETENLSIWRADDLDGEDTFHLELGTVTLHFYVEEWHEFLQLVRGVARATKG